jgi:hypothetical protein
MAYGEMKKSPDNMSKKARGLKAQCSPAKWEAAKAKMSVTKKEIYRKEKIRIKWGLPQKTKWRVSFNNNPIVRMTRYRLRKRGYIIELGGMVAYYTHTTQRHDRVEALARKRGFIFLDHRID